MNKLQRIERLERTARSMADILGYSISDSGGYLENNEYCPSLHEILKVIYKELNIGYISIDQGERAVKVIKNVAPNSKRGKK